MWKELPITCTRARRIESPCLCSWCNSRNCRISADDVGEKLCFDALCTRLAFDSNYKPVRLGYSGVFLHDQGRESATLTSPETLEIAPEVWALVGLLASRSSPYTRTGSGWTDSPHLDLFRSLLLVAPWLDAVARMDQPWPLRRDLDDADTDTDRRLVRGEVAIRLV